MDFIKSYIINIIIVIILSVILEIIMPSGKYKKYIKLVVGLLVMMTVIKPILSISDFENIFYTYEGSVESFSADAEEIKESSLTTQYEQVTSMFESKLEDAIKEDVKNTYNQECDIKINFDGENITEALLKTDSNYSEIKNYIQKNYSINNITNGGD